MIFRVLAFFLAILALCGGIYFLAAPYSNDTREKLTAIGGIVTAVYFFYYAVTGKSKFSE
jgi:hypothetical protein